MTTLIDTPADAADIAAARAAYDARRAADAATSAARAANGEGYREVLNERITARRFADKVKAAPRALQAWVTATLKTFHLDAAADVAAEAARWAWQQLAKVLDFWSGFGLTNHLGLMLTTPLRRQFVRTVETVVSVITWPIRAIGRFLRWGMSKFGPTRAVAQAVEDTVSGVTTSIQTRIEQGVQWLEKHDEHGAMTWLRWFFQANLVRHGLHLLFPAVPGWVVYAGSLMVPVYGDKAHAASAAENEAIKRTKESLAKVPTREHLVEDVVESAVHPGKHRADDNGVVQPQMKMEIVVLTDTDPKSVLGTGTVEAVSFVDEHGVRRIRLGEQLLLVDDLPDTITFVGTRAGGLPLLQDQEQRVVQEQVDVEQTVRTAQATQTGRPPKLPRAAQPGRGGTGTPRGRKQPAAASA